MILTYVVPKAVEITKPAPTDVIFSRERARRLPDRWHIFAVFWQSWVCRGSAFLSTNQSDKRGDDDQGGSRTLVGESSCYRDRWPRPSPWRTRSSATPNGSSINAGTIVKPSGRPATPKMAGRATADPQHDDPAPRIDDSAPPLYCRGSPPPAKPHVENSPPDEVAPHEARPDKPGDEKSHRDSEPEPPP